jgi:hypothetical protein
VYTKFCDIFVFKSDFLFSRVVFWDNFQNLGFKGKQAGTTGRAVSTGGVGTTVRLQIYFCLDLANFGTISVDMYKTWLECNVSGGLPASHLLIPYNW